MSETQHASTFQRIWLPFIYLFAITTLEFIIAFTMTNKGIKTPLFVGLTLLKAFYIMAYFMHLKYEKLNFAYAILIPCLFVVVLLAALFLESTYMPIF
jgi:cytochrome c oxidase subunit IV